MALEAGSRVGPYEVTGALGAGGMGEVYRARDARLGRDVAIKGLPEAFARDIERRARFDREARLLASLNHPNIAAIYGLEEVDGTPYLVLELVEGETLAHALARAPLSVRETIELGIQVAAAIEAAHDKGVVHRDLKPGNVMRGPGGAVKVLDFGLARGGALESPSSSALSTPPTMALSATGVGVVLGTAPYMSPEQARGRTVDRRTDVWAFGCILYECLAGRAAFAGETASDILARVLERDPDWAALPGSVPARLRDLVRRCLTKEEAERPRDIGDLKRELSAILVELSAPRAAAAVGASTPSLAVLYFENLAHDPESDYFCAGVTEDILTDLSKIKGLRVASRNAVARYKGQAVDPARVGAELGVAHVLEGSVRRAGDRLRITTQLISTADGFHVWAERFDRTMQDVFAVQEEIASAIARALQVKLTPAEAESLVRERPGDTRAYDLYLKGRALYGRYDIASLKGALEQFEQAVAIDPNYALAYAGMGDAYGQLLQWGRPEDHDTYLAHGQAAIEKALALNPRLPEAHKAHALLLRREGDMDGQRAALLRAIDCDPRFTPALINIAVNEFSRADLAGAERYVRRVLEIDPIEDFAHAWLSVLTLYTGRFAECERLLRAMSERATTPFYITASLIGLAWCMLDQGRLDEVEPLLRQTRERGGIEVNVRGAEAALLVARGKHEEARAMVRELVGAQGLGLGGLLLAARAAVQVGERDVARAILALPVGGGLIELSARLDPGLHPLLDEPPYAPRRWDVTLVWPLEAPMIDPARFELFREVKIASTRPPRSSVLGASAAASAERA